MSLGLSPKQHRARAKVAVASIEQFAKKIRSASRKHKCGEALSAFANLSFYAGAAYSEMKGAKKKGAKLSFKAVPKSAGAKALRASQAVLAKACHISKKRVAKKGARKGKK